MRWIARCTVLAVALALLAPTGAAAGGTFPQGYQLWWAERPLNAVLDLAATPTSPPPSLASNYNDKGPDWSPDGSTMAFDSARDRGGDHEIWLWTPATGALRKITSNRTHDYNPSWNPAGTHVVVQRGTEKNYDLVVINTTTGQETVLMATKSIKEQVPSWGPGGILYSRRTSQTDDIYMIQPDGTGTTAKVATPGQGEYNAVWHPAHDGSIVYTVDAGAAIVRPFADTNFVRRFTTGAVTPLPGEINSSSAEYQLDYSVDGEYVALVSNRQRAAGVELYDVFVFDADTGAPVWDLGGGALGEFQPEWGPFTP